MAKVAHWGVYLLCAFAAWLPPTARMMGDMSYFLKTGIYNKAPLFSPPRWPLLLVAASAAVAGLAHVVGTLRAPYRSASVLLSVAALGVGVTAFALYLWIYVDLLVAKLWGTPHIGVLVLLYLGFEVLLLATMYVIAFRFAAPRTEGQVYRLLHGLFVSFCSTGLAKTILLLTAPNIPLWGLARLTCSGPCL
jgi:hypothetical protein